MFSFLGGKTPTIKPIVEEKLVHMEDYMELSNRLQSAKDRIQELEAILTAKEQLHDELQQKIQELTGTLQQEKSQAKDEKQHFAEEEDALAEEIADLKVDLIAQESHYETLRNKFMQLQAQQEEQMALQQQYRILQTKMDEKEREYETLVLKLTELESAKKLIEYHLVKEKNEHRETKSALETEKKAKLQVQAPLEQKQQPVIMFKNNATLFHPNQKKTPGFQPTILPPPWNFMYGDF